MALADEGPMMRRSGISLIELLVSIGILAIILAVALPALQSARESARRVQCQCHVRQILVAAHSHHTTFNVLQSLYNGTGLSYPLQKWDLFHMHSWRVALLPQLEQETLRAKIKLEALATASVTLPLAQTVVPILICPSGGSTSKMGRGLKHEAIGINSDQQNETHHYHGDAF